MILDPCPAGAGARPSAGLVILAAGVIPKQETFFPVSMACVGALLLTAVLVLGQAEGTALGGHYVVGRLQRLHEVPGARRPPRVGILLSLDFNEREGHRRASNSRC